MEEKRKEELEKVGEVGKESPVPDTAALELDDEDEEVEFTLSRRSLQETVSLKSFEILCLIGIGSFG